MKKLIFFLFICPVVLIGQVSENMTLLGHLDLEDLPTRFGSEYNDCWGFRHANGTEIAIIGGMEDILFVNVTSPANPQVIYTHHVLNQPSGGDNMSLWRDFKTYGNYAYAAADEGTSGLLIFDLSQVPASVTMVNQTVAFWNKTHNIFIDELHGRLYAAGSNTQSNGLVVLDLTGNPAMPTLLGNVPLNTMGGGYVHDVYVSDNIVYCSHGSLSKLQMYDFSAFPTISVVGSVEAYPEAGYNHSSWVSADGNYMVMADETHGSDLKLIDISDPENISGDDIHTFFSELLGPGAPGASIAHNPFILGDYVYISYYHDGVQVFDISDPQDIQRLSYYDTYPDNTGYSGYDGCWGVYPYLPSGIILASDQNYGLYVLQVEDFPLDVQFISFDAARKSPAVNLVWTVTDISDGEIFEIMRSVDGGITFEVVGKTSVLANEVHYAYTDLTVFENQAYVYRIDCIQRDGQRVSTPLRQVRAVGKPGLLQIQNPFSDQMTISLTEPVQNLQLALFNIQGQLVWQSFIDVPFSSMDFSLATLSAGSYILSATWNGGEQYTVLQKGQ